MAARIHTLNIAPVSHLTARELLRVADRSHPHVDAMATHLERMLDGHDAIRRRFNEISESAEVCAQRISLLDVMPARGANI